MQPVTAHGPISNAPVHTHPEEDIHTIAMYLRRLEPQTLRGLANGITGGLNLVLEADGIRTVAATTAEQTTARTLLPMPTSKYTWTSPKTFPKREL
jgi:hypothetical protein